jgi:hypothetical protein
MELDWLKILAAAGITTTSAALTALVVAFLAQRFFDHLLKTDLENHRDKLKTELETHKNNLKIDLESHKGNLKTDAERAERIRIEMERWANPIIDAVRSLDHRLTNILDDGAHTALKRGGTYKNLDWTITYDYFMPSTVFLFAQYFCWQRLLEESLRFDLFQSKDQKGSFLAASREVGECLSAWPIGRISRLDALKVDEGDGLFRLLETPAEEKNQRPPVQPGDVRTLTEDEIKPLKALLKALPQGDRQVFRLQQRAMGETLIVDKSDGPASLRFAEFLDRSSNDSFRARFTPLREFLEDLQPHTRRWMRLKLLSGALAKLDRQCEQLLGPPKNSSGA